MADDDEIDVLGDFSFNSCFAQNNQGIPSCSDREDTVHPQWLLDSTATNWYDAQSIDNNRRREGPSRRLSGNNAANRLNPKLHTSWSHKERYILKMEMTKYGRDFNKISQTLKTKTPAEVQALIEAEYGIHLETPVTGFDKQDAIPAVVQKAVDGNDVESIKNILSTVTTATPTIPILKVPPKGIKNNKSNNNLNQDDTLKSTVDPTEIFYEDDLVIGSTELVSSEIDVKRNIAKQHKEKVKVLKKIGNHRRKVSRNYDKGKIRNRSKDNLKSPQGRHRTDSGRSEDSVKSPKLQIVLGSGQALPLSEGEQVIKIEKKKESECESDIEIDVDSDTEASPKKSTPCKEPAAVVDEAPVAVPLEPSQAKFEPMPKRNRKIKLDGDGGYTIMHTAAGDLLTRGQEPRKERAPKKAPVSLIKCAYYTSDKPAPCIVHLSVSALISMECHAAGSRAEVMGLVGGEWRAPVLRVRRYRRARAAAHSTHCDMDPVSQAAAASWLRARSLAVCGWHHSHPRFPADPSALDLRSQRALQRAFPRTPLVALVTTQRWPQAPYRCIVVEDTNEDDAEVPAGYQLTVKLVPDITADSLPELVQELREQARDCADDPHSVDMARDVCPQAGVTYLEKCLASMRLHLQAAGYDEDDPVARRLLQAAREVMT